MKRLIIRIAKSQAVLVLFAVAPIATAGPRSSAAYSISTEIADQGGTRSSSTAYANDGSIGGVSGISTAVAETIKAGYVGQLYEPTGLTLTSATPNVDESTPVALGAWQSLDDGTFLAVDANSVGWMIMSGPITSISATGIATAGTVHQNSAAAVQGSFGGFTGTLTLSVLNTLPDNFGSYAGDGLDDAWQNQYFGLDNPLAAPALDPDGDGQTNLFEFTAGLVPTDPASRFALSIAPVPDFGNPGQFLSGQRNLIFSPLVLIGGRSYTVKFRADLATGTWTTLTGTAQNDNGPERTVTDFNATGAQKFYQVEITKPQAPSDAP